nr:MAG TPA: hypothetical protein [Caudoviricetes sp.]
MNKALYTKVKDRCKDTHLSEKYLKEITETLGDVVEDDSTDEELIEKTATKIANIAKSSQGEATRWAQKAKENANPKENEEEEDPEGEEKDPKSGKGKGKTKPTDDPNAAKIKELEEKIAKMEGEKTKSQRAKDIATSMEKHNIPKYLRDRLAKSISDDEDIEDAVSGIKQDLITDGLMSEDTEGEKAASEKQIDTAADGLLESITAK